MPLVQIFQHSDRFLEVELSGQTDSKKHGSKNAGLRKKIILYVGRLAAFEILSPPHHGDWSYVKTRLYEDNQEVLFYSSILDNQ